MKFPEAFFSRRFGAYSAWGCHWPPALSQVQWVKPGASWLVWALVQASVLLSGALGSSKVGNPMGREMELETLGWRWGQQGVVNAPASSPFCGLVVRG